MKQLKKFLRGEDVCLCDGSEHWSYSQGYGIRNEGVCSGRSCTDAAVWDPSPGDLAELGLYRIPDDHVFVMTWFVFNFGSSTDYFAVRAGGTLTTCLESHGETWVKLLAPGESVEVSKTRHSSQGSRWNERFIVRNSNGQAIVEDAKKEERKQFARDQIAFLRGQGLSQAKAFEVMNAAGPGQVAETVRWTNEVLACLHERGCSEQVAIDTLDVVLSGVGGTNGFGYDRMVAVLGALDLPVPGASSSRTFFQILAGAKQFMPARKWHEATEVS